MSWINKNNNAEQVYLGQEGLKLGKNFAIDQNGNISWNSNNSPIKQIYCIKNNSNLPSTKADYEHLGNNDDNNIGVWHKIKSNNDLYYAQSSDGGDSWIGPLLIQGIAGNSINEIKNLYLATITNDQPKADDKEWKTKITDTSYSESSPYLWVK